MKTRGGGESASEQLRLANDLVKSKANVVTMSQYQRDLMKWSRNVDKRYAWVILGALWIVMAASLGLYRMYGLVYAKVTAEGVFSREDASWPVSMVFTVENIVGPFVSIVVYYISFRKSILIGGILLVVGNGAAFWSETILLDILLIGTVQGIGYAFISMPFMEIVNHYFIKYRNMAMGFALCGGTISVLGWLPVFRWILDTYHWRTAYLAMGIICCLNILMVPLLRPNQQPTPPKDGKTMTIDNLGPSKSQGSYKNGQVVVSQAYHSSGISNNCEPKTISNNGDWISVQNKPVHEIQLDSTESNKIETVKVNKSDFEISIIWSILKTPGFHVIWYLELIYYLVFSTYCWVLVDYGADKGCTKSEAENLLNFRSIGEIFGRLVLTYLVDMKFISNRNTVILILVILAGLLVINTYVVGTFWFSILTMSISGVSALLYILLNGLLVDFLGENQVTLGYGMASSIVGVLIIFRPQLVGYFRDTLGSYDELMICFGLICVIGAVFCMIEPLITRLCRRKQANEGNIE